MNVGCGLAVTGLGGKLALSGKFIDKSASLSKKIA